MTNSTMRKFGYPDTLLTELDHWAILLRRAQVTLGSLVLASKSEATAYSGLPLEAFTEQGEAVRAIETALQRFTRYERINYLMLMMVDPHVHFHVIPRYSEPREWRGRAFQDTGWPGPPALKQAVELNSADLAMLRDELEALF